MDTSPMWRRAASYVAKILRGAQPADLPVEQAANFEFAINLKTAKAIGVTLPTSIPLRAAELRLVSNEQRTQPGRSFFGRA